MGKIKYYRDGLEELIDDFPKVTKSRSGNIIESYSVNGQKRFFVTLADSHYCAHGSSIAEATSAAVWKDPAKRPSAEKIKARLNGDPKATLDVNEFRVLTGACLEGCKIALKREGLSLDVQMTPKQVAEKFGDWGQRLLAVLR